MVPYKFESPPAAAAVAAARGGAPADTAGGRAAPEQVIYNPQPICTVLAGNLYNDDKILRSLINIEKSTTWHLKHPAM